MVVGESKRANIMEGIENTGDVRLHDHRLRLKQRFDIVRKLGQGTYGKVQLGINKKTGQEVAIKTIKKCKIETEADLVRIRREVQIMSSVRHPNIVHIYEVFENSEKMILVMEYCSGGELYDYLSQRKVLQEDEARRLFRQIATAVYYCHIHKICHRDLKLENVLLDETGSAKIADFGLSNVFKEACVLSTFCGSPLYASPEIVKGTPYIGPEVDCWSLGVLLYTLVYGAMPFDGSDFKRLVKQISKGDYFEPKCPSSASPLIRDMLTVDPVCRADITYICGHSWVNDGYETGCLEIAEALAAETPVRLDLLLSLAPPTRSHSLLMPAPEAEGSEEAGVDPASSASMAIEPSTSAEKRILELVAEGGADAIKPSPTRTLVSAGAGAGDGKRKLELAASASGMQRKKERVGSSAKIGAETTAAEDAVLEEPESELAQTPSPAPSSPTSQASQHSLKSSATATLSPAPAPLPAPSSPPVPALAPSEPPPPAPEEHKEKPRPKVIVKKKISPHKSLDRKASPSPDKDDAKAEAEKASGGGGSCVAAAADRLTSLSLAPHAPATTPLPKPKKLPGSSVGTFKEQFERRASLTSPAELKKPSPKPAVATSKIAKAKSQSEDREVTPKADSVRLQQIGIEPAQRALSAEETMKAGIKKTESEPAQRVSDPNAALQDARRSLQNSMAMLAEQRSLEDNRRKAARDIISTAIRTGKPPMPYGRSSSAGVTSLSTPPGTPPVAPSPRTYRTEALHTIGDHRNSGRGTSVERIIPIQYGAEEPPAQAHVPLPHAHGAKPTPTATPTPSPKHNQVPFRRVTSNVSESSTASDVGSASGEPIKKSAREFIIPIAVEGVGYVTPRQGSLEPAASAASAAGDLAPPPPRHRLVKPRRISLVSGGESEEEDDTHMHRLRSTRAARAESVSSGEEEEDEEGFQLLTADNLFSTLLHRVRALTQRLNGEEGTGFPQHSLFNNLQSPFFNSPHLPRRHRSRREGPFGRDLHAEFDSMFNRRPAPRGSSKKASKPQSKVQQQISETKPEDGLDLSDLDLSSIQFSEKELETLSGLTPALSRRLQKQLLAQLPPAAARTLKRTLSMHNPGMLRDRKFYSRSHSASKTSQPNPKTDDHQSDKSVNSDHVKCKEVSTFKSHLKGVENEELTGSVGVPISEKQLSESIPKVTEKEKSEIESETKVIDKSHSEDSQNNAKKLLVNHEDSIKLSDLYKISNENSSAKESIRNIPRINTDFTETDFDITEPQFSTLPRLKRHSILSRDTSPSSSTVTDSTFDPLIKSKEITSRGSSVRSTPDRPLLSKFLTPERAISADESFSSESGSLLSEPSYIAAYGNHSIPPLSGYGSLRRHSMRSPIEPGKRRISRFLRPDFFETPREESIYAKNKKDKELETQKVLKEIRERRNKTYSSSVKSSAESSDFQLKDDTGYNRKCMSPLSILPTKDRSRSNTPFFPILDNIRETVADTHKYTLNTVHNTNDCFPKLSSKFESSGPSETITQESKLIRPKSFPIKKELSLEQPTKEELNEKSVQIMDNSTDQSVTKESKLIRPKSYPSSSPSPEKVYINRNDNKEQTSAIFNVRRDSQVNGKDESGDKKDIEVSFNISLPKKISTDKKSKVIQHSEGKKSAIESEQIKTEVGGPTVTSQLLNKDPNTETKTITKKKVVKKIASKSKSLENGNISIDTDKNITEKKKTVKKIKDKDSEPSSKKSSPTKKKSMLQSLGQKLEKLTSKTASPEKDKIDSIQTVHYTKPPKLSRKDREHSVPVYPAFEPETNIVKRSATLTNVTNLEPNTSVSKTTVSKVLGLFKKSEVKDKSKLNQDIETGKVNISKSMREKVEDVDKRRPTSLLLNGLGRKKYTKTASDSISLASFTPENDITTERVSKNNRNLRSSLKLDFSRLPRVKQKVAPMDTLEPVKITNTLDQSIMGDNKEKYTSNIVADNVKEDNNSSIIIKCQKENSVENNQPIVHLSPEYSNELHHPLRNHESTTPDKEDLIDRIRRKSFYSRFNEKRQKRKSNIVGPGAPEYNPAARLHPQNDVTSTSPPLYDVSPVRSPTYEASPAMVSDRFRAFVPEAMHSRTSRIDNSGPSNRVDNFRSLDRSELRKYPGTKSYMDYDMPSSYGTNSRYTRTMSMLNDSGQDDNTVGTIRDPHRYDRSLTMYSPGSYATYRPMRVRNPAIILKDEEKEPSPENVLDKIRRRKNFSISVTTKDKDNKIRPTGSPKGESDGAECSTEKTN